MVCDLELPLQEGTSKLLNATLPIEAQTRRRKKKQSHTVGGRNPAPVDMQNLPLFTGFYLSQVVQDFFHQQYPAEETTQKEDLVLGGS